jgi:D-psicose/D-tagatose/L-ribulose 3-epimerase
MRFAICNELFGTLPFDKSLELIRAAGFDGVEIAPFTLFGDFTAPSMHDARVIAAIRRSLSGSGVAFAGLHWLFIKPEGLHATTGDRGLRRRSWDHLRRLLDFAGELGGGPLIFGSPKQRASRDMSPEKALGYFTEELASIADYAWERQSRVLVEALAARDTDVVNTVAQAVAVVREINKPGVRTMFDFQNTLDESEPWDAVIEKNWDFIEHVHVNEMDGRHPGSGQSDFLPAFKVLQEKQFDKWISLEIFFVPDDPARVLGETMEFYQKTLETADQEE